MQESFPTVMFGCNRNGHTHFSEVGVAILVTKYDWRTWLPWGW